MPNIVFFPESTITGGGIHISNMAIVIILVVATIIASVIASSFLQRPAIAERLAAHETVIEAMLGVVGTLFSVLLGLLVANAIENFHDVHIEVTSEANSIANVFRTSQGLDEEDRVRIRTLCRQYVDNAIEREWPLMLESSMCPVTWGVYQDLWESVVSVEPETDRQSNLQQALLESMQTLGESRRARSISCTARLSPLLWFTILCGSAITIIFVHLFTQRFRGLHLILTALVTISLGLNVWLLIAYSEPFSGDLRISPKLFQSVKEQVLTYPDTAPKFERKKK